MPGPVAKRSDRKIGNPHRNDPMEQGTSGVEVAWTQANPDWPDFVRRWYRSLAVSGQAQYYEQADAEYAYMWADIMANEMQKAKPNAQVLMGWNNACVQLLATEGSRRRARIELNREKPKTIESPVDLSDVQSQIAAA